MKRCARCFKTLPTDQFNRSAKAKDGLYSYCKSCAAEVQRAHSYKARYGITIEEYEQKYTDQDGCCALCGASDHGQKRLAVDHDHATSKVRELLCFHCNSGLGKFGDDPDRLEAAATYIRRHKNEETT